MAALAKSDEDGLADVNQRDLMWKIIEKSGVEGRGDERIQLFGKHDEIWRESELRLKVSW